MVDWLGWAQLAVGTYGAVKSEQVRSTAQDVIKKSEQRQDVMVERDVAWRDEWIEPLYKHFLGGGRAEDLNVPGFSEQFQEIDYATANQLRQLSGSSKESQRIIADTMTGGAKLRALAEVARTTADNKARITGEAAQKRRDLDIQLTNEWTKKAAEYRSGVSPDTAYAGEQKDIEGALGSYSDAQKDYRAILESVGYLAAKDKKPVSAVTPVPATSTAPPPDVSTLYPKPKPNIGYTPSY